MEDKRNLHRHNRLKEKILLVMLPLWDTLIPPLGISSLKAFLQTHGCLVKTVDANIETELGAPIDKYLKILEDYIPENRKGNFHNIVHQVIQNHTMSHMNFKNKKEYIELVKNLVYKTFFSKLNDIQVHKLNEVLDEYFIRLRKYFLNLLETEKPMVLGLSVYSSNLPSSLFAFKITKETHSEIQTVMGGGIFTNQLAIGSINLNEFLEKTNGYIDKLIVGEGEILFLKYLQGTFPESQRLITFRDISNKVLDLSLAVEPDYSDFNLEYYNHLATYGSRSCPFDCTFCSETVFWGKYRKRDIKGLVEELIKLSRQYDSQLFLMCDSLLNPIVTDLAKGLLEADVSIYWDGYLRVDKTVCDPENTLLWRRGGFYRARLGVESGSQRILRFMGKNISPTQVIDAVGSLAYAGIKTTTYWIVGYPGETEEDFQQTLGLIEELADYIYEADCNPFVYHLVGQVNSETWQSEAKSKLLYPGWAKDMLITQTWFMDCEPSREEVYQRLTRLAAHCKSLGIPNPYSLYDIYKADERWIKLHKNAVPPIVDFENCAANIINENKRIDKIISVQNTARDEGDFAF